MKVYMIISDYEYRQKERIRERFGGPEITNECHILWTFFNKEDAEKRLQEFRDDTQKEINKDENAISCKIYLIERECLVAETLVPNPRDNLAM